MDSEQELKDPDGDDPIDDIDPNDTNDESQSEELNERYGNSA